MPLLCHGGLHAALCGGIAGQPYPPNPVLAAAAKPAVPGCELSQQLIAATYQRAAWCEASPRASTGAAEQVCSEQEHLGRIALIVGQWMLFNLL